MNYVYIESLVKNSKDGDESSKEKLVSEFNPYIFTLCKKTFIDGYDFSDIQSECYRILFRCVSLYNLENHRFVAYATNGIKNSIYDLIRKSQNRKLSEGSEALILSDQLEHTLPSDAMSIENIMCRNADFEELALAIKNLPEHDQEMINFLFFSKDTNNTVKKYASYKNISYSCAAKRKKVILNKLFTVLSQLEIGGECYGS